MERCLSYRKTDDWIQVSKKPTLEEGHSSLFAEHIIPWVFCFSLLLVVFGKYSEFSCFWAVMNVWGVRVMGNRRFGSD